jgi:hypothetical protein
MQAMQHIFQYFGHAMVLYPQISFPHLDDFCQEPVWKLNHLFLLMKYVAADIYGCYLFLPWVNGRSFVDL